MIKDLHEKRWNRIFSSVHAGASRSINEYQEPFARHVDRENDEYSSLIALWTIMVCIVERYESRSCYREHVNMHCTVELLTSISPLNGFILLMRVSERVYESVQGVGGKDLDSRLVKANEWINEEIFAIEIMSCISAWWLMMSTVQCYRYDVAIAGRYRCVNSVPF